MKQSRELTYARWVAEFLSLTPQTMPNFRDDCNPEFAPASWWKYTPTDLRGNPSKQPLWQFTQKQVRLAWDSQFDIGPAITDLQLYVFDPDKIDFPKVRKADGTKVEYRPNQPVDKLGIVQAALETDDSDWYPYWIGIRYLQQHPKLIGTCKTCRAPVVNRKYCVAHSEDAKREWNEQHAAELRAKRREKYAAILAAQGRKKSRRGRPRLPVGP